MSVELAHQKAGKHFCVALHRKVRISYTLQRKLFAVCQAIGNNRQLLLWHMFIKNSKKRTVFFVE